MITQIVYKALLLINLVLIVASSWFAPKIIRLCKIALFLTALGLGVLLFPMVNLLIAPDPPEGRWWAVKLLLVAIIPLLVEFILLLVIYRKRFSTG